MNRFNYHNRIIDHNRPIAIDVVNDVSRKRLLILEISLLNSFSSTVSDFFELQAIVTAMIKILNKHANERREVLIIFDFHTCNRILCDLKQMVIRTLKVLTRATALSGV